VADLHRAWRRGAVLAFLSPAFATASHPGAPALGAVRWAGMARRGPRGLVVGVLGGVTGASVRRPGARCAGAIGALMPPAAFVARS
jgi:thiamine-phosphate pyrophosphorylase